MHEETKKELCSACPWGMDIDPLVPWLYDYVLMQLAGCPIERWELDNEEWKMLGQFSTERELWIKENTPKHGDKHK
jgi:hypothetical protein